ncbi:unnamed protein product, partial [Ectocarpus sp. 8 AP-2014]
TEAKCSSISFPIARPSCTEAGPHSPTYTHKHTLPRTLCACSSPANFVSEAHSTTMFNISRPRRNDGGQIYHAAYTTPTTDKGMAAKRPPANAGNRPAARPHQGAHAPIQGKPRFVYNPRLPPLLYQHASTRAKLTVSRAQLS